MKDVVILKHESLPVFKKNEAEKPFLKLVHEKRNKRQIESCFLILLPKSSSEYFAAAAAAIDAEYANKT